MRLSRLQSAISVLVLATTACAHAGKPSLRSAVARSSPRPDLGAYLELAAVQRRLEATGVTVHQVDGTIRFRLTTAFAPDASTLASGAVTMWRDFGASLSKAYPKGTSVTVLAGTDYIADPTVAVRLSIARGDAVAAAIRRGLTKRARAAIGIEVAPLAVATDSTQRVGRTTLEVRVRAP